MVEVSMASLLVGVLLVGALNGVGGVMKTWRSSEQQHDGLALAQQMMAEILQQSYEEPTDAVLLGLEVSELALDRSTWDDVDDYDGWSSEPEDKSGTPLSGYAGWKRGVSVSFARVSDPTQSAGSDEGLKRITVTVTDPSGRSTVVDAYRSRWGMLEAPLDADATLQSLITDQIVVGGETVVHGGVFVPNHARDQ